MKLLVLLLLAPQIVTENLPEAQVGKPYEVLLQVEGGKMPLKWRAEGLPPGLSVSDGRISGTPETAGRFVFILEVKDAEGKSDSAILVLHVKGQERVKKRRVSRLEMALEWLVRHQDTARLGGEVGRWDPAGFMRRCRVPACSNPARVKEGFCVGVTALSAFALLQGGSTHKKGKHSDAVAAALKWLLKKQSSDGWFGRLREGGLWFVPNWLYNHALTTIFLCRLLAVSKDDSLKRACARAVRCLIEAQKENSGWGYGWEESNIVLSAFCGLALAEARAAGVKFPSAVFEGLGAFAARCARPDGSYSYRPGGGGHGAVWTAQKLGPTAAGVIATILAGKKPHEKSLKLLKSFRPKGKIGDMTAVWLALVALKMAGEKRDGVADAVRDVLRNHQKMSGCEAGSWDPDDRWGQMCGRVYATAMGALILGECGADR